VSNKDKTPLTTHWINDLVNDPVSLRRRISGTRKEVNRAKKPKKSSGKWLIRIMPSQSRRVMRRFSGHQIELIKRCSLKGKGRLLLVMDDEEIIRLVVGKMLQEIGYDFDFAEDGENALEKYEGAMRAILFRAVILDLMVRGGMGCLECMQKLQEIDPEVKAIASSGYADNPIMSKYRESGFKGIIITPYEIEDLSEILYKIISDNFRVASSKERTQ